MDKNSLGKVGRPVTMHVERGKIREFAKAIQDDNPIYFDEDYATATVGGIMPPPTFFMTLSHWDDTGEGRLDLRIEGEMQAANQRGEVTILGTFSAALPSKSA